MVMAVSSNQAADTAQQHPAAIRSLEAAAAAAASQSLAAALASAQAEAVRLWLHATPARQHHPEPGQLDKLIAAVKKALAAAFRDQGTQARRHIQRAAFNAAHLGARQATTLAAAMSGTRPPPITPNAGPMAAAAADSVPDGIEADHQNALALLTAAGLTALGLAGITGAFNRARRAISRITRATAVAVTSAAANAAAAVAAAIGPTVRLLWVAEPGACAACAAYAGQSVLPGRRFPAGLSLDPKRTKFDFAPTGPPLHPHCRCAVIPWLPAWHPGGTPLPLLLRQRARQSVGRP